MCRGTVPPKRHLTEMSSLHLFAWVFEGNLKVSGKEIILRYTWPAIPAWLRWELMISVAGWEPFVDLFLSTEQLIHHWDEKFWAAEFSASITAASAFGLWGGRIRTTAPFPLGRHCRKGSMSKQTIGHLCTNLGKQENGGSIYYSLMAPKRAVCCWIVFLSCLWCQPVPGHSQNLLLPWFPSVARKVNIIAFLCKAPCEMLLTWSKSSGFYSCLLHRGSLIPLGHPLGRSEPSHESC